MNSSRPGDTSPRPSKARRVLALAGALILAALYLATLILAVTGSEHTMGLLMATLFASIAVPVFIYVVQLAVKACQKKSE